MTTRKKINGSGNKGVPSFISYVDPGKGGTLGASGTPTGSG